MLFRFISGYAPANLIVAAVSFAAIYAFTRMVPPDEYGTYALTASVALLCQAVFFYWLQVGAMRFIARADKDGRLTELTSTIYIGFALCAGVFALGYALTLALIPIAPALRSILWLGLPLVLIKGVLSINQAFHRAALRVLRYNVIECSQAVLGLAFGLTLVSLGGLRGVGIMLGLIAASLLVVTIDLPFVLRGFNARIDRATLRQLLAFGLPLTLAYALNFVLSTSDRMLVEFYLGAGAVGIYSVSYGVVERALTSVFLAISMAAFPLAVLRLEQEGAVAAQQQLLRNGTALLAFVLPACVGLIAVGDHLAAVLIGPEFRVEAAHIMPWIAASTLLAGMQVHHFDHAFHLGRRTGLFLWSAGPAALLNIVLNIILLPRVGLMGAVYATVISYAVAVAGSVYFGRRAFVVPFPFESAVRIVLAIVPMFALLKAVSFSQTAWGLAAMIASGGATYASAAIALNVGGVRELLARRLSKGSSPNA